MPPASEPAWGSDEPGPEYRVRADRSHARFRAQVRKALEAMDKGMLDKVVLARSLAVRHRGRFELPGFLASLRALYPTCTTFAIDRGRTRAVCGDRFHADLLRCKRDAVLRHASTRC